MLSHLTEFFGRTHLLVLHFPIALLIVAAMIELSRALLPGLRREARREPFRPGAGAELLLVLALLATIYTVAAGLVLGYNEPPKVDLHRIMGIVTGVLVLMTFVAMVIARGSGSRMPARLYLSLLCLCAILVGYTGHLGGGLVYGSGYITRPLEAIFSPKREAKPEPTALPKIDPALYGISQASLDLYLGAIQPILEKNCVECHGPDKAEQDVRLDTLGHILDPATEVVVRGDPIASELYYRIDLPAGDPDIMPPEDDGEPLKGEQVLAVKAWIESLGE